MDGNEPVAKASKSHNPKKIPKKKGFAVSDENVVDTNIITGDGIDKKLHPNADQSDFDSEESEFKEEIDCQDVRGEGSRRPQIQSPRQNQQKVVKDNKDSQEEDDEFDALFDSERVQKLFNKIRTRN